MENFVLHISTDNGKTYKKLICEPYKVPIRKVMRIAKEKARLANICNRIAVDGIIVASLTN